MPLDESEGEMCWIKCVTENVLDKVVFAFCFSWIDMHGGQHFRRPLREQISRANCVVWGGQHCVQAVPLHLIHPTFAEVLVNDCQCEITVCLTCSLSALSNLVLGNKQVENPELSALSFPHYDACLMPSIYGESRCTAKLLLRFSTLSNHKRVAHTYAPVIGPCGSHHIISIMIIGSHRAILLLLTLANSLL